MKVYYKEQVIALPAYRRGWGIRREREYTIYAEQSGGAHKNTASVVVADLPIATATYHKKDRGLWLMTAPCMWHECHISRHRNSLEVLIYRNEITETHIISVLVFDFTCQCQRVPPTSYTKDRTPCGECWGEQFPYRSLLERALIKAWCYHCKELH